MHQQDRRLVRNVETPLSTELGAFEDEIGPSIGFSLHPSPRMERTQPSDKLAGWGSGVRFDRKLCWPDRPWRKIACRSLSPSSRRPPNLQLSWTSTTRPLPSPRRPRIHSLAAHKPPHLELVVIATGPSTPSTSVEHQEVFTRKITKYAPAHDPGTRKAPRVTNKVLER